MKKILSLIIILALMPVCAFAAQRIPVYKVENVLYFFDKSSGTITGFAGEPTDLVIPTSLNGYSVVSIGAGAFKSSPTLRTLTIPDGIYSICANAFCGCNNLTSVKIGSTVSYIGDSAFAMCSSLNSVSFSGFLDNIEQNAFSMTPWMTNSTDEFVTLGGTTLVKYNGNKETVTVPAGIKRIAENAFAGNFFVKEVILPDGLEKIGDNAFVHCYSLEKISIPTTVAYIGAGAFDDTVWLASQKGNFICVNGILISYRGNDRNVSIPYGIYGIGSGAFMSNEDIVCVNIPSGVIYIDSLAFSGCENLLCASIPDSVEWIDEYAFAGCINLSLYISENGYPYSYAQSMEINLAAQASVAVNGQNIIFEDAFPVLLGGTSYIPVRAVLENLGFTVAWDSATGDISCFKGSYLAVIKSNGDVYINGVKAPFCAETVNINGRTLYPSRTVAALIGASVEWDSASKRVLFTAV